MTLTLPTDGEEWLQEQARAFGALLAFHDASASATTIMENDVDSASSASASASASAMAASLAGASAIPRGIIHYAFISQYN